MSNKSTSFAGYLQTVRKTLSMMSETDKDNWIVDQAMHKYEDYRDVFLDRLRSFDSSSQLFVSVPELDQKMITDWVEKVSSGKMILRKSYDDVDYRYYEYDDDEENYHLYDDHKIIAQGMDYFELAKELMFYQRYDDAVWLFDNLLSSVVQIDCEYDPDALPLIEVIADYSYGNEPDEAMNYLLCALYCNYQTKLGDTRTQDMFSIAIMGPFEPKDFELFAIQGPEHLKGVTQFWAEWIQFLMKQPGDYAAKLLIEAGINHLTLAEFSQIAVDVIETHPLVIQAASSLLFEQGEYQACEALCLEGLAKLPINSLVRSELAELALEVVEILDHSSVREMLLEEAFYANPTVINYIRLFSATEHKVILDRVNRYIENYQSLNNTQESRRYLGEARYLHDTQHMVNHLYEEDKDTFRFLSGNFEPIYEKYIGNASNTFVRAPLAIRLRELSILLLLPSNTESLAMDRLIKLLGISSTRRIESDGSISKYLALWKDKIFVSESERLRIITWLEQSIKQVTEEIVGSGDRKNYSYPAELIVSFGEALESMGNRGALHRIVEQYKERYRAKRAFRGELDQLLQETMKELK